MQQQQFGIREYIWQSINGLPDESLNEILSFVIYVRKKVYQPELFTFDFETIENELAAKSKHEEQHLENEFDNYKNIYPHE